MTFDSEKNQRFTYKARLPKKKTTSQLLSQQDQANILFKYEGNRRRARVLLHRKEIPQNFKFYFQLGQTFGSYDESDTFSLSKKPKPSLKDQSVAIIPCYNVEDYCQAVVENCLSYVGKIILINDGSTDNTTKILRALKEKHPEQIDLLDFNQNRGKGFCLLEGMNYACKKYNFEALVTIDSDMQHDPKNIPKLVEAVCDNEDLVIGTRVFGLMPLKNRLANSFITLLLKRVFPHAPHDTQSGYRGFSKPYCEEIVQNIEGGQYEMELNCLLYALSSRKHIRALPIETIYINQNVSSHFSSIKDSLKILKTLLQYAQKVKK